MNVLDDLFIKACDNSSGKSTFCKIDSFLLRCKILVECVISMCENNLSTSNVNSAVIKDCISKLRDSTFIKINELNIQDYNKIDCDRFVNISLKPLANIPSDPPRWLFVSGLIGIWWFIHMKNGTALSEGQITDIWKSLIMVKQVICKKTNDLTWYSRTLWFFEHLFSDINVRKSYNIVLLIN